MLGHKCKSRRLVGMMAQLPKLVAYGMLGIWRLMLCFLCSVSRVILRFSMLLKPEMSKLFCWSVCVCVWFGFLLRLFVILRSGEHYKFASRFDRQCVDIWTGLALTGCLCDTFLVGGFKQWENTPWGNKYLADLFRNMCLLTNESSTLLQVKHFAKLMEHWPCPPLNTKDKKQNKQDKTTCFTKIEKTTMNWHTIDKHGSSQSKHKTSWKVQAKSMTPSKVPKHTRQNTTDNN